MNHVRWVVLILGLVGICWINVALSPSGVRYATEGFETTVSIVDERFVVAREDKALKIWDVPNRVLARSAAYAFPGDGLLATRDPDEVLLRGYEARIADLADGELRALQIGDTRVVGYGSSQDEIVTLGSRGPLYAKRLGKPSAPGRHLPLGNPPVGPTRIQAFSSSSGAFAAYDLIHNGLWSHFPFAGLAFVAELPEVPEDLMWSDDGGAFAYRADGGSVRIVTPGGQHQWPMPGTAELGAISSEIVLLTTLTGFELRKLESGELHHAIEVASLHSLRAPATGDALADVPFRAALSADSHFLLVDCASGNQNTTSVTDLRSGKTRMIKKRKGPPEWQTAAPARDLFISTAGSSVLRYRKAVDYVKAGSRWRKALVDPTLNARKLSSLLTWLYRIAMLTMALIVATSLSRGVHEAKLRNFPVIHTQALTVGAIAILLVPGFVLFVIYANAVSVENKGQGAGIMSGGLAWLLFGCVLFAVVIMFAKIAVRVAGFGMRVALAMNARPADAAVIVPLVLAMMFLVVPPLASVFQEMVQGE